MIDETPLLTPYPNPKIKTKKNTQTPTGIMISTKKQFHPLGENQRQPSPSLTNQTLCVYEHFKTMAYLLSGKLDLNRVNGFLPTCF